jgi:hypothetical protein
LRAVKVVVGVMLTIGVLAGAVAAASIGGDGESGDVGSGDGGQSCGEIIDGDGPDGSVGYVPCDDPTPVEPKPQIVEPTPGMASVFARPFDTASVRADGRTIAIDFVSGIEPCSVLDHVDVLDRPRTVTITLFEGHDPAAGAVACIEIGVFKRVLITLDEPLGDRSIVDGAAS